MKFYNTLSKQTENIVNIITNIQAHPPLNNRNDFRTSQFDANENGNANKNKTNQTNKCYIHKIQFKILNTFAHIYRNMSLSFSLCFAHLLLCKFESKNYLSH